MKRTTRIVASTLVFAAILFMFTSCKKLPLSQTESGTKNVYSTFYPLYALTEMLVKDVEGIEINCLIQPQDGCLRDYQLSNWDLALLSTSDMIIAGGEGLESFEELLYTLGESGPAVTCVLHGMDLKQARGVNTQDDSQSHWLTPNPHIYMSINASRMILKSIAASLSIIDEKNAAFFQEHLTEADAALEKLHLELTEQLSFAKGEPVIVMNEALFYLAQDFNFDIDLCYERESGEEVTGSDLSNCLSILDKSSAQVVLIEKQAPQSLCEALEAAGFMLARLDTLSTRRAAEGSEGYFAAMRENARILSETLSAAMQAS